MKDSELTLDKKKAIDSAISAAADHFGLIIKELARDLANSRATAKRQAKQIANLKSQLHAKSTPTPQPKPEPKLPAGFKFSPDTNIKRAQLTAELSALRVQEQRELSAYESQTIAAIAQRNQKAHKEQQYAQALKSDFSTATAAIVARKRDIETNGQTITTDYSGNTAKVEIDLDALQLFTFTRLTQPDFEYQGKMYQLTSADCSEIGAGNRYTFIKSN
jgi:hypothetical protein